MFFSISRLNKESMLRTPQTLFVPSYKAFRLVVLAKKILKVSINQKQELPMAAICSSSWQSSFREEVGVIKIRKLKDRQHNSQKNDFFFYRSISNKNYNHVEDMFYNRSNQTEEFLRGPFKHHSCKVFFHNILKFQRKNH